MPQNLIEKIVQKFAPNLKQGTCVQQGDFIFISPQHLLTHDNTGAVITKFQTIGAKRIHNPRQPMFALDHNVQDTGSSNLQKYADIEAFANEMGVDFYPAGRGIGHQIMCEEGYAWPGTLVMASDSHANMYGGLGVLGTPVVRTDAAAIWATGQTWWQIPPIACVELNGTLRPGVTGKDVIITLTGIFNKDEVLNHALEFSGDGVASLSIEDRLTIANMTTEWGALAGVFPIDIVTFDWLESRAVELEKRGLSGVPSDVDSVEGESPRLNFGKISKLKHSAPFADPDAYYAKTLSLDLASVEPYIAGPDSVKKTSPANALEIERLKIHKAYLLSCVNGRVSDLADAAQTIKGQKVADHVEFYMAAASSEVQIESEARGDWQTLIDAGAMPLPPGCGPCIGLGLGLLGEDEVGISATNRNFKGRMGAQSAKTYLASPSVVAASAVAGMIVSPFDFPGESPRGEIQLNVKEFSQAQDIEILDGFPPKLAGNILFCHQDNLNTDGIFPGKYTYIDTLTPEQLAAAAMENYDIAFKDLVKRGDFLVGGFNFGTGSSREQAVTALKYCGLALVIAGSFSETYKRNAINNGFLALEAPDLVKDLLDDYGREILTVATDIEATIHFSNSSINYNGKMYSLSPVGIDAQALFLSEGLENWVKERLT
ncbi:MAG: homoaconitase [Candidatus Marinimicrobia bacterium]|jgi:homoaconitate hydratase|nr:homoaconitase [Candidatus Neomarinimicrobiota bacterium]MBT3575634.1 homoaconitase [Candidatus Neomarinimicrobiota bacterium]MBT3679883.1 homoaconitase [Candidatus Neomarinimicrobiota bacterium]MBT3952031.1 homoaconitase [Candidatus Neomarinimicrobiota bacterium]MBT4251922.1 homoaconitase [Candidatus Neomarinimicrobiota bacterium]